MTKKQPKVLLRCAKAASSIVAKITIGVNATIKHVLDFGLHIYILNGAKGMNEGEVGMTNREAIEILGELKKCYLGGIVDAIEQGERA
jgi:hypothetical protein